MSSKRSAVLRNTAAWRLSALATGVFVLGTAAVFAVALQALRVSIHRRDDVWLTGEIDSLAQVAVSGSLEQLAQEFTRELNELRHRSLWPATKKPKDSHGGGVFLALLDPQGHALLIASNLPGQKLRGLVDADLLTTAKPHLVRLPGLDHPVRVVAHRLDDGRILAMGQSQGGDQALLEETAEYLAWAWFAVAVCGFAVSWLSARRVLARVDKITALAGAITGDHLEQRLPHELHQDEISRLAETFNVMLDRVESSVTQLRTVGESLAHDLRSPVTAIRASLEVALTDRDAEQLRDDVAAALEGLDHLSATLDASLDTAEAQAGALRLRRTELDLKELVEGLIELYLPAARERGLALGLQTAEEVTVSADEGLVRRAVANLLDNGLAHLPPGCRIAVTVGVRDNQAFIDVADDGPGFPSEVRDSAFERSVRGGRSHGAGLGLALVRAVALMHGGDVHLLQPSEGGSVIRMMFPLKPA
jgi:signal transduction histidine kinase